MATYVLHSVDYITLFRICFMQYFLDYNILQHLIMDRLTNDSFLENVHCLIHVFWILLWFNLSCMGILLCTYPTILTILFWIILKWKSILSECSFKKLINWLQKSGPESNFKHDKLIHGLESSTILIFLMCGHHKNAKMQS